VAAVKINRFDVRSFVISGACESQALLEFERKRLELSRKYSTDVKHEVRNLYVPLLKVSLERMPRIGEALRVRDTNYFFLGLSDGNVYYLHSKGFVEKLVSNSGKGGLKLPAFDRFSLLSLAKISPAAVSTLGYLLAVKKTKYSSLDPAMQKASEELTANGYARIYIPGEDEPFLQSLTQGIVDSLFNVQRSAYYVKCLLNLPRFSSGVYNLSSTLTLSEAFEGSYKTLRIQHTPDKLGYILGVLFNSRVALHEVVYLPIIECVYRYLGRDEYDVKFVSAMKGVHEPKNYVSPYRPEPLMLGTSGVGINSTPVESAAIKFSNVAGMEGVKEELRKAIIYPLTKPELSKEFSRKAGGGILLYGPPGCGKTFIMQATVGEAGVNLYTVDIQDIIGGNPEAGSEKLHEIFKEARASAPSILFFDEIDALGGRRSMQSAASRFIVNQFLTEMSGVEESNENVLIVGATNAPWDVDPALRRSGRFTTKVFIPPPDFPSRVALFMMCARKRPVEGSLDYNKLAELTEYYSSSDITALCDKAAEIPWSESMKGMLKRGVRMEDFMAALGGLKSTLVPWFALAEGELSRSGESDVYPELNKLLEEFHKTRVV